VNASRTSAADHGLIEVLLEGFDDFLAAAACPDFAPGNLAALFCLGFAATLPLAVKPLFFVAGFVVFGGLRVIFAMIMYT
jgi:hypothetical protein